MPKLARLMAWTLAAALVFVTLAPIGLRPVVTEDANVERALAYALLGFLFAIAYPRHWLLALCAGIGIAAGLEVGQIFAASRHGRVADFLVKASAAGIGVAVAQALLMVRYRWTRREICPGE
ncbi:hypothetical protein [Methylobacterium haplocladii]|uniref:VanZ-like domain-containing protein n=1 Tax=Methylobacterium haplocladii TaxID=1176176 RepID=A0A512IT08_9HYPH|nr:hypothetical protein [Methylobacterium haplocladii]GEP00845.1 hypothetical protein MHA02_32320 [Methylobacterium haplocladii]GJD86176.1 hypothetical protein HPGCJGGD_4073 [Methylobacterium haplocladii]GLS60219.1 hypothetical protein GCM10007887_28970 [Methylobacterium haplocladii]